jgi:hypothetical protein
MFSGVAALGNHSTCADVFASLQVLLPVDFTPGIALVQGPARFGCEPSISAKQAAHDGNATDHHRKRGGGRHRSAAYEH